MGERSEVEKIFVVGVILFAVGWMVWVFTHHPLFVIIAEIGSFILTLWWLSTRNQTQPTNKHPL